MEKVTLLLQTGNENGQLAFFFSEERKEFLFRGADAAVSLGYKNSSRSIRQHVTPKWIVEVDDGTAKKNKVLYLTEAGFHELAFSSGLECARKFREWVFDDVLTSIREKGWWLDKNANAEQLLALQEQVQNLLKQNENLQTVNKILDKKLCNKQVAKRLLTFDPNFASEYYIDCPMHPKETNAEKLEYLVFLAACDCFGVVPPWRLMLSLHDWTVALARKYPYLEIPFKPGRSQ